MFLDELGFEPAFELKKLPYTNKNLIKWRDLSNRGNVHSEEKLIKKFRYGNNICYALLGGPWSRSIIEIKLFLSMSIWHRVAARQACIRHFNHQVLLESFQNIYKEKQSWQRTLRDTFDIDFRYGVAASYTRIIAKPWAYCSVLDDPYMLSRSIENYIMEVFLYSRIEAIEYLNKRAYSGIIKPFNYARYL